MCASGTQISKRIPRVGPSFKISSVPSTGRSPEPTEADGKEALTGGDGFANAGGGDPGPTTIDASGGVGADSIGAGTIGDGAIGGGATGIGGGAIGTGAMGAAGFAGDDTGSDAKGGADGATTGGGAIGVGAIGVGATGGGATGAATGGVGAGAFAMTGIASAEKRNSCVPMRITSERESTAAVSRREPLT